MSPSSGKISAFTLLELLLVIVLVTLFLGLSSLRLSRTHQYTRLHQCAETFDSQVSFARQLAILSNRKLTLNIDVGKKEVSLRDSQGNRLPDFHQRFKNPYPVLSPNIELEADEDVIGVFPTGQVDAFSIRLKDGKNILLCENSDGSGKVRTKDLSE